MAENETNYRVKADLVLDATKAQAQAVAVQRKIQDLGRRISGTSTLAGGLTRNMIAMGATYLGVNAVTRAFTGLTRGATAYASELEKTRIGLTSVLAAVQGTDWATAQKTAGTVFEQMRQDSIKSVATAQQLFTLYQGIVGPISQAGFGLETVRDMTKSAVSASGVLGVDLDQAQRDMSLMVRGAAGMDVKLFSLLRSTGAIAETTEQWNKNLSAQQRVEKLQAALGKFAPAGDRFAKSWAGVTSTFKGIREEFTRSAWQPVMNSMARALGSINDRLIDNQETLQERLQSWGDRTADRLDRVFGRANAGASDLIANWDQVMAKAERFGTAGKVAAVGAGVQAVRPLAGGVVGAVGGMAGLLSTGTAAAAASAAGAGGTAAAGGAAAAGAGAAVVGPAIAIVAAAAAAFAGAAAVVSEQWEAFSGIMDSTRPVLAGLWQDMMGLGMAVWEMLLPGLKMVGHMVLGTMVPAFTAALAVFRVVIRGWKLIFEGLGALANIIYNTVKPAFDAFWKVIDRFVWLVMDAVSMITGDVYRARKLVDNTYDDDQMMRDLERKFAPGTYKAPWDPSNFEKKSGTPNDRAGTVNDFRGSRIEVKQTFKDQDPDRVMVAMVQGLQRQAEMRIQSGMLPALGR